MASRTHGITLRDLGPVGDILFAGDGIGGQVPKRRHLTILKSLALEETPHQWAQSHFLDVLMSRLLNVSSREPSSSKILQYSLA
jgi:hypothetical protein